MSLDPLSPGSRGPLDHARRDHGPGPERQAGLVKAVLLFALGLLAGANLVYFAMTRDVTPRTGRGDAAPIPADGGMAPATAPRAIEPPRDVQDKERAPPSASASAGWRSATARSQIAAAALPPLLIPVQGVVSTQLQDTFNDARAEGRRHDAIDIMAPAGTPVLAVADGTVEKLFTSEAGGLTIYQFEPGGRYAYYYAHLQGYAPGLAEKQALRRGDVLGYVGSTGNANPAAPHLHFAVFELGPERRWWQGTAINPYPLLRRP